MNEIWKEVPNFEGKYYISNTGKLKSIGGKFTKKCPFGYITEGCVEMIGYRVVALRKPGILVRARIHTLVANAFVKKPESKVRLTVNHIDGNKINNNADNLEWITSGDNVRHAVKIGLHNIKGEKHPHVKLTEEKVIEMRRLRFEEKLTHEEIAKRFGVCRRQAGDVINGVNWGWLTNPV